MASANNYSCADVKTLNLPRIANRAGNITPINGMSDIPFEIARVYYLYDIPSGESRGGHAHKQLQQLIVAASGSFTVKIDDGTSVQRITLNRPDKGIYLLPGIWRELEDFSSGAICLVLASREYDPSDYIRDYDEFVSFKKLS